MKLPEKIIGKNKIRDAAIVVEYKKNRTAYKKIAEMFNLTERRILQILSTNHAFIKIDKEWEREKRIARLDRWLNDPKNSDTRKDPLEVQQELRKEIEGDKPLVDNSQHFTQLIYVRQDPNSANRLSSAVISD